MRYANSHADCQPISNGYVYAYPDSCGLCYTYGAGYGYTYS